ncbi:hypothetical protein [Rhodococcus sovatensis]|uniref:DUF389 domain-containing protein n=1 Tax=Rhodococcus sovatensis TaxID=1805840 RepID=A0ABZ2PI82_9NOCA
MSGDRPEVSLGGRIKLATVSWVFAIASCIVVAFVDFGLLISIFLSVLLAGISLVFWIKYFRGSIDSYMRTRADHRGLPPFVANREFLDGVAKLDISELQASTFLQMVDPQSGRIERISESVEQHVRSVTINTSLTVLLPSSGAAQQSHRSPTVGQEDNAHLKVANNNYDDFREYLVLPLVLQGRGRLLDNFRVHDANEKRISTLTYQDALMWQVAIIRKFVRDGIGKKNFDAHYGAIEAKVIGILSSHNYSNADDALAVESSLIALSVAYDDRRRLLLAAARIVLALSEYYAGCVMVPMSSRPTYAKFAFERREIPHVVEQRPRGKLVGWFSPENLRDGFRAVLGVRPSSVQHPLSYVDRARSYHVQVRGPDGTYLGRQRIVDSRTGKTAAFPNKVMRARYGQRYSHLYVRNSWRGSQFYYESTFYERPPGSVAVSAMSSVAATFLIALVALSSMGMTSVPFGAAVTTLLAVPAAIGAWSGLDQSRTMVGGVLAARVSALVTIAASFLAILIYSLLPHTEFGTDASLSERAGYAWWVVAFSISGLNALATSGSWSLRTIVYRHFVRR